MREKYLDGLRGWAALIVVVFHTTLMLKIESGLPFTPIYLDGAFSVFIFFALSGYVLSISFYRTGRRVDVVDLALRRYPRFVVPIFVVCAVALTLMNFGLMSNLEAAKVTGSDAWLGRFYNFHGSIPDLFLYSFGRVFTGILPYNDYNSSLWTMEVEMQGSIIIFAMLLIANRSTGARLIGHVVFIGVTLWIPSFMLAMALGAAIANFTQFELHKRLVASRFAGWFSWLLFVAGLASAAVRPHHYGQIWTSVAGAAILYAVVLNSTLQSCLSSRLSQWLGKISFSIYLVHIVVICSFSSWLYLTLGGGAKVEGSGVAIVALATFLVSVAAGAVFYRVELMGVLASRRFSKAVLNQVAAKRNKAAPSSVAGSLEK